MAFLVKDVMRKDVAYVTLPGSRDDVLDILKKKHISGVPVVKNGALMGIVTRVDLLKHPDEEQIAMLMTRGPISIDPEASLLDAARLILKHNIRRLPVTARGTKLLGIVTVADVVETISKMEIHDPIGSYIEPEVYPIWDGTPLPVVGRIFELGFLKAAPVLNSKEELVGLITDKHLIAASTIEDSVGKSDMSAGSDDDAWTWESMRDTMKIYYGIAKVHLPEVPLREAMAKHIFTAFKGTEVSECARRMRERKFDQAPVVDAHNKLIGMVRDRDLLKALVKHGSK
ncbi:MAG: CBS domain-containing protein [Euryarchaeota archaeon]|nr:CBS domain-containing protein [Euryarchaeota archaeon]